MTCNYRTFLQIKKKMCSLYIIPEIYKTLPCKWEILERKIVLSMYAMKSGDLENSSLRYRPHITEGCKWGNVDASLWPQETRCCGRKVYILSIGKKIQKHFINNSTKHHRVKLLSDNWFKASWGAIFTESTVFKNRLIRWYEEMATTRIKIVS